MRVDGGEADSFKGLGSFNHPHIWPHWQNRLAKASLCSDRRMRRSKGGRRRGGRQEGGRVKLKGHLYLLRIGQTQPTSLWDFFYGSPKRCADSVKVCVCVHEFVCEIVELNLRETSQIPHKFHIYSTSLKYLKGKYFIIINILPSLWQFELSFIKLVLLYVFQMAQI